MRGAYIGHPMCETTRKPNILAQTRDKEVIHQTGSFCINYTNLTGQGISLCRENFAR